MAIVSATPNAGPKAPQHWWNLVHWWRQSSRALRHLTAQLVMGVAAFSIAMYLHAWFNIESVVFMWVVAACIAVITNTFQARAAYIDAAAQDEKQSMIRTAIMTWQGIWAVLTCGIMICIVLYKGPTWTMIDTIVTIMVAVGLIMFVTLWRLHQAVWAKFSMFVLLKVIPQCCQAALLSIKEAEQFWFPLAFALVSLAVGYLRFRIARDAYEKMKHDGRFTEARANVWCWSLDMLSFGLMAWCLIGVLILGPLKL